MQMRGVVEAVSVKPTNTGVKIGPFWYSSFKGEGMKGIEKGDEIEFEYTEKGQYRNIVSKSVKKLGAASNGNGASHGSPGANGKSYDSAGMEIGHASKLAMWFALALYNKERINAEEIMETFETAIPEIVQRIKNAKAPKPVKIEPDDEYGAEDVPF